MDEVTIAIRWRDMDNYGHVNNAVYLNYLEECRDRLVERSVRRRRGMGLRAGARRHRLPQRAHPGRRRSHRCGARCAGFGRSSIRTRERIEKADGTVAAEAEAVIVPRDPEAPASRPLTEGETRDPAAGDRGGGEHRLSATARGSAGGRARSGRGTSRPPHPHDRDAAGGVRRIERVAVADVDVDVVDRAVVVPVVEHQVPREQAVVPEGAEASHVGRRPLGERPARVGTWRVHVPCAAVVGSQQPPRQARAVEPGDRLAAEGRRGVRPPHSPPHT